MELFFILWLRYTSTLYFYPTNILHTSYIPIHLCRKIWEGKRKEDIIEEKEERKVIVKKLDLWYNRYRYNRTCNWNVKIYAESHLIVFLLINSSILQKFGIPLVMNLNIKIVTMSLSKKTINEWLMYTHNNPVYMDLKCEFVHK